MNRHIHFVTGKLAQRQLKRVVDDLAVKVGFAYSIDVMPITVAALLTPKWIAPRLNMPPTTTEIMLPGYCDTDLEPIQAVTKVPIVVGPKELRALPDFFGESPCDSDYGDYQIEIIAEINHAPRMPVQDVIELARQFRDAGANVIDVGCDPGQRWDGVADCVRALRDEGHRISIDSFDPREIAVAVKAGAELVLSVNSSNREAARDWGCEVVVIPDDAKTMCGFDDTIELMVKHSVPMRLDPILEPIGCGFAQSLGRYLQTRHQYGDAEMMMGIGNLTELTDVDSAGINVLLLGFCQELGIRSVLTTAVINWARTSVQECDVARRLAHYAVVNSIPPKRLDNRLVMLRDEKLYPQGNDDLENLATTLKDTNYRLFAESDKLHLISADLHLESDNAFDLFLQLMRTKPDKINRSHAFYLGYELAKATTALTLGKQYNQDQALDWGFLTQPEETQRQKRSS